MRDSDLVAVLGSLYAIFPEANNLAATPNGMNPIGPTARNENPQSIRQGLVA